MTETVHIRKYQKSDKQACRRLWRELTEWHREIYQDSTIGGDRPENYFDEHLIKIGTDLLWVAVQDTRVLGLAGLEVQEEGAVIEPVIIESNYRGKGIGTQLLYQVISEAKKLGVKYLSVKPVARNRDAIRFFYQQGFRTLGHIELFMDLTDKTWKSGTRLFNLDFNF